MTNYQEWINNNVAEPYGACREYTKLMNEAFPELRIVRGHYYCYNWGEREHWWCLDPENKIVDPTAHQFPSCGKGYYSEWDESREEPTGHCLNCGEYTFDQKTFCSEDCEIATRSEFNSYLR